MHWDDQSTGGTETPPPIEDPATTKPATDPNPFRRTLLTAGMAAALLVAGGAAVVAAASPDPSTSPVPGASGQPSTDGSTDSSRGERLRDGQPCDEDSGGSGGSGGSDGGQTPDPSPDTPDPSPSTPAPLT
jgi:hypothetical protein